MSRSKFHFILLFIFFYIIMSTLCAFAQDDPASFDEMSFSMPQLVTNGSFTGGKDLRGWPNGWFAAVLPGRSMGLKWGVDFDGDDDFAFIAQESADEGVFNHWAQRLPVPYNCENIIFEFDAAPQGITGPGGKGLLELLDSNGETIKTVNTLDYNAYTGTGPWLKTRIPVEVPAECQWLEVRIGLEAGSTGRIKIRRAYVFVKTRQKENETVEEADKALTDTIQMDTTPIEDIPAPIKSDKPEEISNDKISENAIDTPPESARQLIKNPDFREVDQEGNPLNWFATLLTNYSAGEMSKLATDEAGPYIYLTQQRAGEGVYNNWGQRVDNLTPGARVRLQAVLAIRDVHPGAFVRVEFFMKDGVSIAMLSGDDGNKLSGTVPWHEVIVDGTVPENCAWAVVRFGLKPEPGRGTIYIRSARLLEWTTSTN